MKRLIQSFICFTLFLSIRSLCTRHRATDLGSLGVQYPWIVSINMQFNENSTWKQDCSGTVVHRNYILTTGECVKDAQIENIRLAVRSENSSIDDDQGIYSVISKVIHPEFNQISSKTGAMVPNDIALLKVSRGIRNPSNDENIDVVKIHSRSTRYPHSNLSIINLDVDSDMDLACVKTSPIYSCNIEWIDSITCLQIAKFYPPPHPQREICAHYSGCNLLSSDIGSPLVYYNQQSKNKNSNNNDPIQVGLLSRLVHSRENNQMMAVFSLAPTYRRWINRHIRRSN